MGDGMKRKVGKASEVRKMWQINRDRENEPVPSLRFSHMYDFGCVTVGPVAEVGAIGCHAFPVSFQWAPMGSHGRESTGVSQERGKSTVAHRKNIAFGDVA